MKKSARATVANDSVTAVTDNSEFLAALRTGLSQKQKQIPSRFFYDARGSALFEDITRQPEYYPTNTECAILADSVGQLNGVLDPGAVLVEFGSGSSRKTEILLSRLKDIETYIAIDISPDALDDACLRLSRRFPGLKIVPVVADISATVRIPAECAEKPKLGFFPGSTIGNFETADAIHLLQSMSETLGRQSHLVIGVDLKKSVDILHRAYNDAAGVTADFNLNLLRRANRELDANFDLGAFRHEARYDEPAGRIDMFLVSRVAQDVRINGDTFHFAAGERVHTEYSHKYSIGEFSALAAAAGWAPQDVWTDPSRLFSVHCLANS